MLKYNGKKKPEAQGPRTGARFLGRGKQAPSTPARSLGALPVGSGQSPPKFEIDAT